MVIGMGVGREPGSGNQSLCISRRRQNRQSFSFLIWANPLTEPAAEGLNRMAERPQGRAAVVEAAHPAGGVGQAGGGCTGTAFTQTLGAATVGIQACFLRHVPLVYSQKVGS